MLTKHIRRVIMNTEFSKAVGSRIREVRRKKGMSQAELAAKANISVPHISAIELGKSQMMLPLFVRLLEVLDVSADYLLRANVTSVNGLYQSEFAELLADCSPQEMEAILDIVRKLKSTLHQNPKIE